LAALLLAGLLLVACGGGDPAAPRDQAEKASGADPVTTTTAPPPPSDAVGGTSVLLAGDSIMRELVPALEHGVEDGGADTAEFVLAPSLPHRATDLVVWRSFLERRAPDVVVLHIGSWERLEVLGDFATGARVEPGTYRSGVVDPALDLVEAAGAELLWVSPIPVRDVERAEFIAGLAATWQEALADREEVTWVDVRPVIAPGGFVEAVDGPDGPVRLRRSDGIHLCPDGQRRVAQVIVAELRPHLANPPRPGWADAWRAAADEPGGCAPYTGAGPP
jgi:hypothetical protein